MKSKTTQTSKLFKSVFVLSVVLIVLLAGFIVLKQNQEKITRVLLRRTSSYDEQAALPWDFRVLSFNINHGTGTDGGNDLQRIASIINRENPFIVCLNDVDKHHRRSNGIDQARKIAALTGMQFTSAENDISEVGTTGNAILTKLPVYFSENKMYSVRRAIRKGGLLHVILLLNNERIHVYTTTLSSDSLAANQEFGQMYDFIRKWEKEETYLQNEAVIVAGTFNMKPGNRMLDELDYYFTDAFKNAEPAYTFPAGNPQQRPDYLYINKRFTLLGGRIIAPDTDNAASTHLPLAIHIRHRGPVTAPSK